MRIGATWLGGMLLALLANAACAQGRGVEPVQGPPIRPWPPGKPVQTIGFGSCLRENRPAPILRTLAADPPDVYIFLGDNIYGDTDDPAVFRAKYARALALPGFRELRERSTVLAVWDDHDYGRNDAGAEFPAKELARRHFLHFWGEAAESSRWTADGNYASVVLGPEGRRVQVLLLDTRWSRSPLQRLPRRGEFGPYAPSDDPDARVLGETQWAWLTRQLQQPAEVRVIASSIQVLADEHNFEKWGNFPREKQRLLDLLDAADGAVIVLSGDRHRGEISRATLPSGRRLYDVTSSALNQGSGQPSNEPNALRRGPHVSEPHTALLELDWSEGVLRMQLRRESGSVITETVDRLSALSRPERPASEGGRPDGGGSAPPP